MSVDGIKKKVLFIDRDGTLIIEPPVDFQVDSLEKLEFLPGVVSAMHFIASRLDYELVMVTNQDGLGTEAFPEQNFWPAHNKMLKTLENEGVVFSDIIIDRTLPEDNAPTRKPGTALLTKYMSEEYDMAGSYVIGDRLTDAMLARNLGCKAVLISEDVGSMCRCVDSEGLGETVVLIANSWNRIADFVQGGARRAHVKRRTKETDIEVVVDIDGLGNCEISTGLGFFDHMLEQIGRHAGIDLQIKTVGDLHVDEHHTIEDTAIVLGEALRVALGDKRGIARYGYVLPMDDCLCTVAVDFGGRSWLVWDVDFRREKIGDVPTEMFIHFFKSLSDSARMNLFIRAEGDNEHHKIEGIFKALACSIKMAVERNPMRYTLPSTKGML